MTPNPEARRRALQLLASTVGPSPAVRLQPEALAPLAPALPVTEQEGVVTERFDGLQPDPSSEEERLRERAAVGTLMADLGQSSSRAIETLTGAPGSGIYEGQRQRATEPLRTFLELQQRKEGRGTTRPASAKPQASTDPSSPASKRKQMLVKATLGDVYADDEIAQMAEADADEALKYGSMRGTREVGREGHTDSNERARLEREERARIWSQRMGLEYDKMSLQERLAADRLASAAADRDARLAKDTRTLNERNVGGYAFDAANPPSADAAKKMADVSIQSKTITGGLDSLEKLYRGSGTEITGETAGTMAAEWKNLTDMLRNISNMGVPNGKDYEMLAMQLENPTELKSFLTSKARGLAQMATVRKQIQRLVQATAEAYKYKAEGAAPAPQAGPPRVPVSKGLPTGPDGKPTLDAPPKSAPRRRRDKSGQLWEEQPDGSAKKVPG